MYEINALFFYKAQFMVELLVAEFLFSWKMKRRNHFALRVITASIVSILLSFAVPIISYDALYISFLFILLAGISICALGFCFKESFINIVFSGLAGYSMQHIAYSLYQTFMVATLFDGGNSLNIYGSGATINFEVFTFAIYVDFYIFTYLGLYLTFKKNLKKDEEFYVTNTWLFLLVIFMFISAIVLNSIMIYKYDAKTNQISLIVTFIYSIISCLLVLVVQFKLKEVKKTKKELEIVQHLWKEDREHYDLAKENIKLINIKCHDLKHQIHALAENKVNPKALKEIEKSVMIYDSIVKTGNDALDVLLSEKSLFCNENKISLTYIVNGESLSFMQDYDIYSLFGNALDNAIEYLLNVEEDKRFIRLNVNTFGDNLVIHIENYFDGELSYDNGLPKTTKQNKDYHGFGLVSIKTIVENYHGDLFIKNRGNLFIINILIPYVKN